MILLGYFSSNTSHLLVVPRHWLGPVWAFTMRLRVVVALETGGWGGGGGDVATDNCCASHGDQVESHVTYL